MSERFYFRVIALCAVLLGALIFLKGWLLDNGAHHTVLIVGNLVLAILSLVTYRMSRKGVHSDNNATFVMRVYGAMISRMMLCLTGITVYAVMNRAHTSKMTIFILMFFYCVYAFTENVSLQQVTRRKN
jgi:hypothetical protein